MGNKRKSSGGKPHPTMSFEQMVSKAALDRLKPYIAQMAAEEAKKLENKTNNTLNMLFGRIVVLEQLAMDHFKITDEQLADKLNDVEDGNQGLAVATDQVVVGDLVRLEIKTKDKDAKEWAGSSRIKVYQAGSGQTLGAEIEKQLPGMKPGEVKAFDIGKEGDQMTVELTINRISREIKPPTPASIPETDPKPEAENTNANPVEG